MPSTAISTPRRQALERNAGVHIDVVIKNSPAFRANVLPGDVIVTIDGLLSPPRLKEINS